MLTQGYELITIVALRKGGDEMSNRHYRLVFIVGAEGSGNQMLHRILGTPTCAMGHSFFQHRKGSYGEELNGRLRRVGVLAWDRYAEFQIKALALRQMRVIIDQIMAIRKSVQEVAEQCNAKADARFWPNVYQSLYSSHSPSLTRFLCQILQTNKMGNNL